MRRKLIRQGKNALTITLPSKWTALHNLTAGSEVDIVEKGGNLLIEISHKQETKKIDITLTSDNSWYVGQVLRNAYLSNYNEIHVHFTKKSILPTIQEKTELLLGYEIISKTNKSCIIKNITKTLDSEFDNLLRRIFLITFVFIEDIITSPKDFFDHEKTRKEILNIKRFYIYTRRILVQDKLFNEETNRAYYILLHRMVMIINNFLYISRYASSKNITSFSQNTVNYMKKILIFYRQLYEILYKEKCSELYTLSEKREELLSKTLSTNLEKASPKERMIFFYLGEIVRMIGSSGGMVFTIITSATH